MSEFDSICNFRHLSPLLTTAGQPTESQLKLLADNGIEVVVNLGLTNTDYALADERSAVEALGMEYVHIPVAWDAPADSDLDQLLSVLRGCNGRRLFVHCAKNMRVSVFMALYRVLDLGWTPEAALVDVRSIWEPDAVWRAFFKAQLARHNAG